MSGSELTSGAVPAHMEEQEREISVQAEATRGRIAELTAHLEEFDRVAEDVRITRETMLALPDPSPPTPPAAKVPGHPAYQQITAVFAAADTPPRARADLRNNLVEVGVVAASRHVRHRAPARTHPDRMTGNPNRPAGPP